MPEPTQLDVWENLMIRACKSLNKTEYRLRRIFGKRCALRADDVKLAYVIDFLLGIIDKYKLCSLPEFIGKVREHQNWENLLPENRRTTDPMLSACVSILAHAKPSIFPNYHPQLYWRQKGH